VSHSILLVEDDPDSRHMIAALLESAGHAVVTASNGRQAVNLARQHQPALILLDLMMPVMTGEEFRQAQMDDEDIKAIPVVVISAHHEARRIADRMQASACLQKPVDLDALLTICATAGA
jgi:CheY-like chemotaxis protein